MYHFSADVGGTFVDLVLLHAGTGQVWADKVAATQLSADGILSGIRRISGQAGIAPSDISRFVHGFTIATNAWLTRSGARAVLVVTEGFRDLLEIGSQRRPLLYSLTHPRREALIPRSRVMELRERMAADGSPVLVPETAEITRVKEAVVGLAPEAVGISLLFSYVNPDHERHLAKALRAALPEVPVYLSSQINPQVQEYPRANTVAASAYVGPKVRTYVSSLEAGLRDFGFAAPLMLMRSDGGIASPIAAAEDPATMLLSGPAGGVIAAAELGRLIDVPNLVTFDMGGTSADFSLIADGQARTTAERAMNGQVLRTPMLDIETISAGGGSIAWLDRGGALHVGPDSAGSRPGPACYGLGGTEPTLTDATVCLGIIHPDDFAGGDIRLDVAAAREAIERVVARPLGFSAEEAAWGMIRVACAQMRQAIRALSVERGHDLREFSLLAFGGAGPIFGAIMLEDLGVERLLIPPRPGVFAALGLLLADVRHNAQKPFRGDLSRIAPTRLRAELATMIGDLDALLERDEVPPAQRGFLPHLDLRYAGQFHELTVPIALPEGASPGSMETIARDFHTMHERLYGYSDPSAAVEAVGLRVHAHGRRSKPTFPRAAGTRDAPRPASTRQVALGRGGERVEFPVYRRDALSSGQDLAGPAIVSQRDTTVLLMPGQTGSVDPYGNLHIRGKVTAA